MSEWGMSNGALRGRKSVLSFQGKVGTGQNQPSAPAGGHFLEPLRTGAGATQRQRARVPSHWAIKPSIHCRAHCPGSGRLAPSPPLQVPGRRPRVRTFLTNAPVAEAPECSGSRRLRRDPGKRVIKRALSPSGESLLIEQVLDSCNVATHRDCLVENILGHVPQPRTARRRQKSELQGNCRHFSPLPGPLTRRIHSRGCFDCRMKCVAYLIILVALDGTGIKPAAAGGQIKCQRPARASGS